MATTIGSILPVGTIIHSMLTTTQFASEYGTNWVLADGRSVTGTLYASVTGNSTIPDMRGAFLRAKGSTYNPDGDLTIGTYTADKFNSHDHPGAELSSTGGAITGYTDNWDGYKSHPNSHAVGGNVGVAPQGGNETAPRSITVNVFIRIN